MARRTSIAFSGISWSRSPDAVTLYSSKSDLLEKLAWLYVASILSVAAWPVGALFGLLLVLYTCVPYKVAEFSQTGVTFYPTVGTNPQPVAEGFLVVSERPKPFSIGDYFGVVGVPQLKTTIEIQDNQGHVVWQRRISTGADKGDFAALLEAVTTIQNKTD
jgi:hypothetical protein